MTAVAILGLPNILKSEVFSELEYRTLENKTLALEIGEMLFTQPSEGCWTCHGSKASPAVAPAKTMSGSILNDPKTWTSYKIVSQYISEDPTMIDQRRIALSLIRLGADDWNSKMTPLMRQLTKSDTIFFDDRMIGIHSKYLKKNSKSIIRMLKKSKVKFKSQELMDIMATSVLRYIENKFEIKSIAN